jgi:NAD(P)-dependent dehydrogenase (short-subunit alcohol dehydrogenase family)
MGTSAGEPGRARFQGKVALVTGSSRGYGRAMVRALAAEGAKVVVNSRASVTDGRLVASQIRAAGGEAVYATADVGNEDDIRGLANAVQQKFGGIDIIVHNAARGYERPIDATTLPQFQEAMLVNTYALIALARHFRGLFRERGKFLYVSSPGAELALTGYGSIGAAKAASEAVIRSLALEWAPSVQANAIRPNIISSVSLRSFTWADPFQRLTDEESPLGLPELSQLVNAALWLCGPDSDYVNGQVITVDGGQSTTVCRDELITAGGPVQGRSPSRQGDSRPAAADPPPAASPPGQRAHAQEAV